jgi:O-acetyl-ADP-ribose deacetylase (regulator of RNase III)
MGGGVAGAIRRAGGEVIEAEARRAAPIPLGGAQFTSAGTLPFAGVIHAPTMTRPAEDARAEVVRMACHATIRLAHGERVDSVAFPGMGTGTGNLDAGQAAKAMLRGIDDALREVVAPPPGLVVLVAYDEELRAAFEGALQARSYPRQV